MARVLYLTFITQDEDDFNYAQYGYCLNNRFQETPAGSLRGLKNFGHVVVNKDANLVLSGWQHQFDKNIVKILLIFLIFSTLLLFLSLPFVAIVVESLFFFSWFSCWLFVTILLFVCFFTVVVFLLFCQLSQLFHTLFHLPVVIVVLVVIFIFLVIVSRFFPFLKIFFKISLFLVITVEL